jgi:hypothetical protein
MVHHSPVFLSSQEAGVLVMELTHKRSSPQTQTPVIGWLQKEA